MWHESCPFNESYATSPHESIVTLIDYVDRHHRDHPYERKSPVKHSLTVQGSKNNNNHRPVLQDLLIALRHLLWNSVVCVCFDSAVRLLFSHSWSAIALGFFGVIAASSKQQYQAGTALSVYWCLQLWASAFPSEKSTAQEIFLVFWIGWSDFLQKDRAESIKSDVCPNGVCRSFSCCRSFLTFWWWFFPMGNPRQRRRPKISVSDGMLRLNGGF